MRKHFKYYHTILFLITLGVEFILSIALHAQHDEIAFEHISTERGPWHGTVNSIIQDKQGFIWLGTANGLLRYDGYTFKEYKRNPADSNSISGNNIWSICEDSRGDLWIGTSGRGLNRYIRTEDRFIRYKYDPKDSTSLGGDQDVPWVYEDATGEIWIGVWNHGLDRYDPAVVRDQFIHYRANLNDPQSLISNNVHRIFEDRTGVLWIGTKQGISKFNREQNSFISYQHDPNDPRSLGGNYIYAIFEDSQGNLWFGAMGGGLSKYDPESDDFLVYLYDPDNPASLSSNYVYSITEDSNGFLWVGTDGGGLNRLDPTTGTFTHYTSEPENFSSLSSNTISSLYLDNTGVLWIGTVGAGLNRYDPNKRKFSHYRNEPGNSKSLSSPVVDALCEDTHGSLWIGTAGGGLNRYDPAKQEFVQYRHDPTNPNSLSHNDVVSLYEDSYGDLWIGTWGGGLNRLNLENNTLTRYRRDPNNPKSLSSDYVTSILEDRQGNLWICTNSGGLNRYDYESDTFVYHGPNPPTHPSAFYMMVIYEDRWGDLWVGTWEDGLKRFDPATNRFTDYLPDPNDPNSISGDIVVSMAEDSKGNLWIGTWGDGLNRYNRALNNFTCYTSADGLPNDNVYGLLPDDQGNLWISTSNGLAKFNTESGAWKVYEERDGVQSTEFRRGAYHKGRSGRFYFGGVNGFNAFYPEEVKDNPHIPPIVLTSFKIFEQEVASTEISGTIDAVKEISLSYKDNFFSFEFVALDYTNPQKNQYAYKLEDFDEDWICSGTRRYASYTNLYPGEYIFKVKGSNNDGVWNEEGASVKIIITPPYWQTLWFRGLTASLILLIAFGGYRLHVAKLLEMERLRVRIASDLHDDIGSTLTKISLYSDLIETGTEPKTTQNLLKKIGAMSRELVTTMSDIVWSIDARNDTIGDLIDRMRDFAASTYSPRQIEVQFKASGLESNKKIPVDVRQNLYLIFKEAVNNVAKHAMASKVAIRLQNSNGLFTMTIKDDGRGLPQKPKRQGHGLRNMKMRAERIGAKLEVDAKEGVSLILEGKAI